MESRFFLTDLDYRVEGDEVVTRLYGKTREGGKITVLDRKTKPYFYVLPEGDIENLLSQLRDVKVRGKGFLSIEKVERDYQ